MEIAFVMATIGAVLALIVAARATARARQAEDRARREAAARAEAEERAQREAAAREAEARARAEAEERAARQAERAQREAERAAREASRAQREAERAQRMAERAREAERRAKDAERRAARLGADLSEARADAAQTCDESTLVAGLRRAAPSLDPERARRLENQLESLARLRSDEDRLLRELASVSDEEVRAQLRRKLGKIQNDAEALLKRLRNAVEGDPALHGVRLALAWGGRVTPQAKKKKE